MSGFDLLYQAHRARHGWSSGHVKRRPKINANLNRLANVDYAFEVNASEVEFAEAA